MPAVADLVDYDDDLPAAEVPRDPATGQFLPKTPPQATPQPEAEASAPPAHSPYFTTAAQQLGFTPDDIAGMSTAALEKLVAKLQAPPPAAPPAPAAPVEAPVDWGKREDGTPATEDDWHPQIARAIKAAHRVEHLEKKNAALEERLERDKWERHNERLEGQAQRFFRSRPELFGKAEPGDPFSAEARRRRAVRQEINALVQAQKTTTFEADLAAVADSLYGPAAPANGHANGKAKNPLVAAYANGELAAPSQRRGRENLTRRELLIQALTERQQEKGRPAPAPDSGDDDDDLPDVPTRRLAP